LPARAWHHLPAEMAFDCKAFIFILQNSMFNLNNLFSKPFLIGEQDRSYPIKQDRKEI
jgi:hypothetical protein